MGNEVAKKYVIRYFTVSDGLKFLLRYAIEVLIGVLYSTERHFMGKKR